MPRRPMAHRPTDRQARAHKRRINRGALPAHLPRIEIVVDIDDKTCPLLPGRAAPDRRGQERAAGHRAGAVPGARHPAAQICLPDLRGRCRAGPGAGAADRGRPADRGHRRPGSGVQICRPSAAVSPGPDLRPPGHRSGSLDAGRLGRPCRLAPASAARAPAR